jgi:SOS-response transcriptional repressor LexA
LITIGIKTSCKHKRELHITCRNSNNHDLRNYYKKYCKILSTVITEAKKLKYYSKIQNSSNKNKTIWDIVRLETSKNTNNGNICILNVDGKLIRNQQKTADTFNK